jgi:hypothetical protein
VNNQQFRQAEPEQPAFASASASGTVPPPGNPPPNGAGTDLAGDFLRRLFGAAPPNLHVLIWALKGKRSWFVPVAGLGGVGRVLAPLAGGDVYYGVALGPKDFGQYRRCPADEAAGIVGLWADIDMAGEAHKGDNLPPTLEDARGLANSLGLPPTEVVHSGHGLQPWWLFDEPWVFQDDEDRRGAAALVERFQAALRHNAEAAGWSLDATHDLARVLRVPGTTNYKLEGRPVPVTLLEGEGPRYTPQGLAAVLEALAGHGVNPFILRATGDPSRDGAASHALALAALAGLSPGRADDYTSWLKVGMALHSVADDLLGAWDSWSKACPDKYQDGACAAKWGSFTRGAGGIGLGSLVYWAKQDGWAPPPRGGGGAPKRPQAGQVGWEVIRDYFRRRYGDGFRTGEAVFSNLEGREVRRQEACAALPHDLLAPLGQATDAPQYKGGLVNEAALPGFFKKWAGTGWLAYASALPDEDRAPDEAVAMAREEFRRLVRQALFSEFTLARRVYDRHRNLAETRVENRSAIGWCEAFAREGGWRTVRSKKLWCKLEGREHGEVMLKVALRHELFGQLKADRRLIEMGPARFVRRARRYGVGGPGGQQDRPGGQWVFVLSDAFVADLTATFSE